MKTLGIIGGIGPESTVDYYRLIQKRYRELRTDESYPKVVINSINAGEMVPLVLAGKYDELAEFLLGQIQRLAAAGADFALIAANTPHVAYDRITPRTTLALLSIVEATRDAARAAGYRRVAVFGTRITAEGDFYPKVFAPAGITVVPPSRDEIAYIHDIYMNQLFQNQFLPQTRRRCLAIAAEMKRRDGIEALILAGTELPLLLRDAEPPVPYLDTTVIHVEAAVRRILGTSAADGADKRHKPMF